MNAIAGALLTYVWHYLLARTIYEQLVRPLEHGHAAGLALVLCIGAVAFALGRTTGRAR